MENTTDMLEYLIPSLLISETHFHQSGTVGAIADAAEHAAGLGRYGALELPFVVSSNERKRIAGILRANELRSVQWLGGILDSEGYNLSSLREDKRRKSLIRLVECMEMAAECGIATVGVLSGPDPGSELRQAAIEVLAESLDEAVSAGKFLGIDILLEPLDLNKHKKGLVGSRGELELLEKILGPDRINVSLDTSHILLNDEDPLVFAAERKPQYIHLANPVLEKNHPIFGDRHIFPGAPGVFGLEEAAVLFSGIKHRENFEKRPLVSVEVRSALNDDPWEIEQKTWDFFTAAWNLSEKR